MRCLSTFTPNAAGKLDVLGDTLGVDDTMTLAFLHRASGLVTSQVEVLDR